MLFTAVVFQALAASLALVSARPADSRPRRQLDGLVPTGILPNDLLEPIASPLGKLASSLIPGGITILPELNTIISEVSKPLSSALPVLAPPLSVVTQIVPVSGSSSGFVKSSKPTATHKSKPKPSKSCGKPKPKPTAAPSPKPTKAPAAASSSKSCGTLDIPCLLEPVASLVKSLVPPITALPVVNSVVSKVDAAISSAVPQLSTPKEITDKILPFPIPAM